MKTQRRSSRRLLPSGRLTTTGLVIGVAVVTVAGLTLFARSRGGFVAQRRVLAIAPKAANTSAPVLAASPAASLDGISLVPAPATTTLSGSSGKFRATWLPAGLVSLALPSPADSLCLHTNEMAAGACAFTHVEHYGHPGDKSGLLVVSSMIGDVICCPSGDPHPAVQIRGHQGLLFNTTGTTTRGMWVAEWIERDSSPTNRVVIQIVGPAPEVTGDDVMQVAVGLQEE